MKNPLWWMLLILIFFKSFGQFYEDFSDGNFTTNPTWQGDVSKYKISSSTAIPSNMRPALQSDNTVADTTYLSSQYNLQLVDSVEWEFWIKLSFNPSSSNYARVYLLSNNLNLTSNLQGYFISVGYQGVDRIHLVRQDGNTFAVLLVGTVANLNKSTNALRIKVKWYDDGTWRVYSDTLGGDNYVMEGLAMDLSYTQGMALGVYNCYTSSNATKFYFDEFYAGPVRVDTIPPQVTSVKVLNPIYVQLTFSEPINSYEALDPSHYIIDQGIGEPWLVEKDLQNPLVYYLTFSNPMQERTIYYLTVNQISDLSGNYLTSSTHPCVYYVPRSYDVVINEIMADPTPSVTLPEYEYIELFNTTDIPISLDGFKLVIGTSVKNIGNVVIPPQGYLILCDEDGLSLLSLYGQAYGFSSFSVTNTGTTISLLEPSGSLITTVSFTDQWYGSSLKANGGWSLEQIDPYNPCGGAANWKASEDFRGGTPGQVNSVKANNPDNISPYLMRVTLENDSLICIWFSESMDSLALLNPASYSFSHQLSLNGIPDPVFPEYKKVYLSLNRPIGNDTIYEVTVDFLLSDCAGNQIDSLKRKANFAKPKPILPGDLIINEILSNPTEATEDFIEIYNKSNKIVDLKHVTLATLDDSAHLTSQYYICPDGYLMLPGQYLVFTKKRKALIGYYYTPYPDWVIEVSSMPSYNNDHGTVVLAFDYGQIIDQVTYDVSMHDPRLVETDGVSLERISPYLASDEPSNWHSAASTVGYATPTYKNSQHFEQLGDEDEFWLSNTSFSPDNDGFEDILAIFFKPSRPGLFATLNIYNSSGYLVRNLFSQKSIGSEETFLWDGKNDDNQSVPVGYYIIHFRVFDQNGYTKQYKKVVAVVTKFSK
ncbi:MAG: lamin tail domain-containing protein [Bacteroidales bacterium]|nr:lamin tail domain-containing protein [Bacteroidales bacterium]